ncbi:MAG: DUF3842 family protein [Eubacteriales bacterium]
MKIVVIDGQGGGVGKLLVEKLVEQSKKEEISVEIYAIGANSLASSAMLKGGAHYVATGENPVVVNVADAQCILGPVGIVVANAMLGEITPTMATAIGSGKGKKFLVPMNHCGVFIAGVQGAKLPEYIDSAVAEAYEYLRRIKK